MMSSTVDMQLLRCRNHPKSMVPSRCHCDPSPRRQPSPPHLPAMLPLQRLVHVQQQLREGLGEDRLTSWPVPWPLGHRPEALRHGRWPCVPPPGSWPATSPPAPRPGPRSRRHAPERRETGATAPRGPCHELSESFLAPKGRIPGRRSLCMATCKPTRLISGVDTCCSRSQRSAATGRHSAGNAWPPLAP